MYVISVSSSYSSSNETDRGSDWTKDGVSVILNHAVDKIYSRNRELSREPIWPFNSSSRSRGEDDQINLCAKTCSVDSSSSPLHPGTHIQIKYSIDKKIGTKNETSSHKHQDEEEGRGGHLSRDPCR